MPKKLLFNFNREVIQDYTYIKYSGTIITATNTLEKPIKSAILKGCTGYRDIDTGEILETFEEGRNLELVSVKTPVLTTTGKNLCGELEQGAISSGDGALTQSNSRIRTKDFIVLQPGDYKISIKKGFQFAYRIYDMKENFLTAPGTWNVLPPTVTETCKMKIVIKASNNSNLTPTDVVIQVEKGTVVTSYEPHQSNILTVNEDVTLRSNGDVYDELNLLTGRLTQRIDENNEVLSQEVIKTVDLSILDQNENKVSSINSFNDTTHIKASSETIPPIFEGYLATKEVE